MNRILVVSLISAICFFSGWSQLSAQGRSVYFQRATLQGGAISSVPVLGPASDLTDLVKGLSVTSSGGLAANGLGSLYYTNVLNNTVLLADKNGKSATIIPASVGLNSPQAIAFDAVNSFLYIADLGNQRIVRADVGGALPVTSVEAVMSPGSPETIFTTDIKFNPTDNMIYWINGTLLYRADAGPNVTLPISAPQSLTTQNTLSLGFFDLDGEVPQNIYMLEISGANAIYKAPVPIAPNSAMTETEFLNVSADPNHFTVGLAVDKESSAFCFSAFDGIAPLLGCGDTANPGAFTTILGSELFNVASYLVIDKSATIVRPDTTPEAPVINVDVVGTKPQARITLESFTGADSKKGAARFEKALAEAAAKKGGKFGFQYNVEIKRVTDAQGNPIDKKGKDNRNLVSKKNELTVKNLETNSSYSVRYKVEITSKSANGDVKVVKRTQFSPTTNFIVP